MAERKPVIPFYASAAVWLIYALVFPLYRPAHFIIATAASLSIFLVISLLCRNSAKNPSAQKAEESVKKEKPTGNPELDKMTEDCRLAIAEMKRLDNSIADSGISADIVQLEQVTGKILERVREDPTKIARVRKFMDYYLPTTLKLLNAYDRASSAGISGENIDSTITRVAGVMDTIVAAFKKQLDALFGDQALDISTDITVLENMMAREGLTGEQLHAQTRPETDDDIKMEP